MKRTIPVTMDDVYGAFANANADRRHGAVLFVTPLADLGVVGRVLGYTEEEMEEVVTHAVVRATRDAAVDWLRDFKGRLSALGVDCELIEIVLYHDGEREELENWCRI